MNPYVKPFVAVLKKVFLVNLGSTFFEFLLKRAIVYGVRRFAASHKSSLTEDVANQVTTLLEKPDQEVPSDR